MRLKKKRRYLTQVMPPETIVAGFQGGGVCVFGYRRTRCTDGREMMRIRGDGRDGCERREREQRRLMQPDPTCFAVRRRANDFVEKSGGFLFLFFFCELGWVVGMYLGLKLYIWNFLKMEEFENIYFGNLTALLKKYIDVFR